MVVREARVRHGDVEGGTAAAAVMFGDHGIKVSFKEVVVR